MKSIFEQMGGTYRREGEYLIPNLILPDAETQYQIGKYGHLCETYLKDHRPVLYNSMLLKGTLFPNLADIDKTCNERMELLTSQMAEAEGITEALKASSQLEWVGRMNSIRNRAEEIVLSEVVYG